MLASCVKRPLFFAAVVAAVFPVLVLIDFFSFVLSVRLELGRWPKFGDPDPKVIAAGLWRIRIGLELYWFLAASAVALGLACFGRWRQKDFPVWLIVILTIASAALLLAFCQYDPGGFLNWFWD